MSRAQMVVANYNALLRAKGNARDRPPEIDLSTDSARRRDPDATDFHAIIYINDYPQKARWKVTNKETMIKVRFISAPLSFDSNSRETVSAGGEYRCVDYQQGYLLRARQGAWTRRLAQAALFD